MKNDLLYICMLGSVVIDSSSGKKRLLKQNLGS